MWSFGSRYRGWLVRRLCHFLTVCDWRLSAEMPPNLQERLFHTQRVQEAVSPKGSGDAARTNLSAEEWMKEIQRILCQIQACLSPFLLRALLASLGGVFLPQGMGQRWDGEEDALSRAVVASYIEELLLSKQSLLIFLEEVFSGSQQLSLSGRAWLSLVLNAYYAGTIPDVLIVPVSISYEKAPDFIHRGKESPSQTLGLWTTVWTLCRAACRGLGCVRIDLAQPFSLQGVFLSRLMQDFVWITDEILMRNCDVGFSGRVRDVLCHGLSLLRECITLFRLSLGDVLVVPKKTEAAIRELSQHSMALLPVFIQEAVGACSINALLMEVLPYLGSPEQLGNFVLAHEELHNKSVLLPCQSVHYYCQHALDKLVECGLLVAEEVHSDHFVCDTAQKGFAEKFLWKATEDFVDNDSRDETEKQCFKVNQSESCSNLFVFLCGLLGPLLKTLERAIVFLQEVDFPQPESLFLEELHQALAKLAREDGSFGESGSVKLV
ncbi:hypothetical protein Chor_002142 [Crotalus horridus]